MGLGADQVIVAEWLAATTVGAPGAPGLSLGVTGAVAGDATLSPPALVALTVNVYGLPLLRPVTMHEVSVVAIQVFELGDEVTVYLVIGEPLSAGGSHVTIAAPGRGWADAVVI